MQNTMILESFCLFKPWDSTDNLTGKNGQNQVTAYYLTPTHWDIGFIIKLDGM